MRDLEHIDNEHFRMDRARAKRVPRERLVEPRTPKDLEAWCQRVKERIQEHRALRRQHGGALAHWLLMNEVDYVQFVGKRDENRGRLIKVHFWQAWMLLSNVVVAFCGRDVGKALDVETSIPTPDGWRKMGELRPGDEVFGPDGIPTKVLAVTEPMLGRPCYRVRFDDGAEVIADARHEWLTFDKAARKNLNRPRSVGKRPYTLSERSRGAWPQIRQTRAIAATLKHRNKENPSRSQYGFEWNHSVISTKPVQYEAADLPVDPYVLGVWLGDGTATSPNLTIHDDDVAIIEEIRRRGYVVDKPNWKGQPYAWVVRGLRQGLKDLGVLKQKSIPPQYLTASVEQRLALLQGLMDTDGTCRSSTGHKGDCDFDNTNDSIAWGVVDLLRSFGVNPSIRLKSTGFKPCWSLYFKTDLPAFLLPRKAVLQQDKKRTNWRRIVECSPVPSVPVSCIQVARPDGLFLAGRGYVVTHNSSSLKWCLEQRAVNYPAGSCLVTGNNDDRVTKIWTELIQTSMPRDRLAKYFLTDNEGSSRVRPPCHRFFAGGFRLFGRPASEQTSGRVESPHCHGILGDEWQEYSWAAWEVLQPAINPYTEYIAQGSMAKFFGVNGQGRIDNVFYHLAFRHAFYKHYRCTFPSWYSPHYNLEQHIKFLEAYDGSIHSSRFKQHVRGLTGERQRGLVDQAAYNACCLLGAHVGISKRLIRVDKAVWARYAGDIEGMMIGEGLEQFPGETERMVLSMDYGSTAPSEIGIWALVLNPARATDDNRQLWALVARIQMQGIIGHDQAAVVDWLFDHLGLDKAAIDSTAATDKIWEILNDPRHSHYAGKDYEGKIFPAASNRRTPIKYQEDEPNKAMAPAGAIWQPYDVIVSEGWKYRLWALMQHSNVLASQKVASMIQSHQLALPGKDYELQNEMMSVVEKSQQGRQPTYVGAGAYAGLHRFSMMRSFALWVHDEYTLKQIQRTIMGDEADEEAEAGCFSRFQMPDSQPAVRSA